MYSCCFQNQDICLNWNWFIWKGHESLLLNLAKHFFVNFVELPKRNPTQQESSKIEKDKRERAGFHFTCLMSLVLCLALSGFNFCSAPNWSDSGTWIITVGPLTEMYCPSYKITGQVTFGKNKVQTIPVLSIRKRMGFNSIMLFTFRGGWYWMWYGLA